MLWIALYLPELSLQVAARSMGQDRAIIIKDGPANRPIIIAANDIALSLGIQLGAPLAAAEALASGLLVVARNKDNEAHALQHLAAWALQFTPTVTLEPHRGILLEGAPSLRLQGGLAPLLEKIKTGCDRLGYCVIYGIAPTARAAWWFAIAGDYCAAHDNYMSFPRKRESIWPMNVNLDSRFRGNDNISDSTDPKILRDCLGKLQVASLGWPTQTTELLHALGIKTLADCLALPRAGLIQRFGVELANELDEALGLKPDVRPLFAVPKQFHSRIELSAEISEVDALLFPLKRLLIEMEGFLRGLGAGVQSVRVELEQGSRQRESFTIGLLAPEREHQRLLMLISARLANLQLDRSVWAVSLHAEQLQSLSGKQHSFLPDRASHHLASRQLLERLQARLGKDKVRTLALGNDHRPEYAWSVGNVSQRHAMSNYPLRPLWLLPQPRPIDDRDLALLAGPVRIEAGWWDSKSVQRDYYIARNGKGSVLWIYRQHHEPLRWYMHGVFA
ncbi:MAG: DNA polymerase Y family protein [Pseudomonadota bacterium]|nr:DNA polymerase Y family protein [Pseudomonadota bacterium]